MRSTTFLRIASVITLLNFIGHTTGYPWTPDEGPGTLPVLAAMKGYSFDVIGSTRTYWDFYVGFGLAISIYLLLLVVVLWQVSSLAKTDALRVRPIIAALFGAFAVNTVLTWKYFFVIPMVMSALNTVCLALAFVAAGRVKPDQKAVAPVAGDV